MALISKLHYITHDHPTLSHADQCKEACESGVNWIQLRMKNAGDFDWEQEAVECKEICDQYNVTFLINDNVEVANRVMANGVHLGKEDMSPLKAREILGTEAIIGATANTVEDIIELSEQPINYIGLGPFTFTETKKKLSPILGIEGYQKIITEMDKRNINLPIIAIGGIQLKDISTIMETGVHGIAVSGLIGNSQNKQHTVQAINESITQAVC